MKLMKTTEAVGQMLCHDITQIIPGITKDAVFRKGHIIREEDIPVLLSVGKEHVYIWEQNENMLHENDAALLLRDICQGGGMRATEPKEGKIELIAERDGLFMADLERLRKLNALGEIIISTRFSARTHSANFFGPSSSSFCFVPACTGASAASGATRTSLQGSASTRARMVTAFPLRLALTVTRRPRQLVTGASDQSDSPLVTTAPSCSSPSLSSTPALIQFVSSVLTKRPA